MKLSKHIQDLIYSNHTLGAGVHYLDAPIILDEPVSVKMWGKGFMSNEVSESGIKDYKNMCVLVPLGDFPVFIIRSRDVHIDSGNIYLGETKYTSDVIHFDLNERIIRCSVENTHIEGSWGDLVDGYGGNGIGFSSEIRPDLKSEYCHYIDIKSIKFRNLNRGINVPKPNQKISINTITMRDIEMFSCKKFLNIEAGSNIKLFHGEFHSFPVFKGEREYAITWKASHPIFRDVEIYDKSTSKRDTKGLLRHDSMILDCPIELRDKLKFRF